MTAYKERPQRHLSLVDSLQEEPSQAADDQETPPRSLRKKVAKFYGAIVLMATGIKPNMRAGSYDDDEWGDDRDASQGWDETLDNQEFTRRRNQ